MTALDLATVRPLFDRDDPDPRYAELRAAVTDYGDASYHLASGVDRGTGEPLTIKTAVDRIVAAEQRVDRAITALHPLASDVTIDQRREALLELASLVSSEDRHKGSKPLSAVLDLIIPPLSLCPNPVETFNQLVAAHDEFTSFVSDETEYATAHDWGTSADALADLHEKLQGDIDLWADRCAGRQS